MKTITVTKTVCKFEELSPEHKAQALDRYRDWNTSDSFWHECVIDDAKEIGALMGIYMDNIYFRGFWSQGDGACFVGSFRHVPSLMKGVKEYASNDDELHAIAKQIQELHRLAFYGVRGSITHSGRYYHERSMSVDVYCDKGKADESDWKDAFADLAQWIYRSLEKEYDYQMEDEQVAQSLIANDVEFVINEDGELEF